MNAPDLSSQGAGAPPPPPSKTSSIEPRILKNYLQLAVEEARKGVGLTAPNPPVGAVIVSENGTLLGRGYHHRAGSPHAEIEAIADATKSHGPESLRGATICVTLEPCSTSGKTPPCCDAIRDAGIRHVIWGSRDPNPAHAGRATEVLTSYGITFEEAADRAPDSADACDRLIRPFAKWVTKKLPWVIAKVGASLDGRITRPPGESQWITSPAAREDAHHLRSEVDAILIGAETLRADDPALTIRGSAANPEKTQPWRAVVTRSGNIPGNARMLTDEHRARSLVYRGRKLRDVLADLATEHDCLSVLVEGGANLHGQLFAAGLIDEVCFYLAPRICAGGLPAIGSLDFPENAHSWELQNPEISILPDHNIRIRALPVLSES